MQLVFLFWFLQIKKRINKQPNIGIEKVCADGIHSDGIKNQNAK